MTKKQMKEIFNQDITNRYKAIWGEDWKNPLNKKACKYILKNDRGLKVIKSFRYFQYVFSNKNLFNKVICHFILRKRHEKICIKYGCELPLNCKIGPGFVLVHTIGVVIASNVEIGESCSILSGCVIGRNKYGVPTIGNNVAIGANCTIVGNIKIGNNSFVGAGATCTKDVPDNSIFICDSAHFLKFKDNNMHRYY